MKAADLAAGTLEQYVKTGDGCFLDNADADMLRDMVRLATSSSSGFDLKIQRERDRLRREAQSGPCPTCGRLEDAESEKTINSYAQRNSMLLSKLQKAGLA